MSNPFPVTVRPWLRITDAKRATSNVVLEEGDFAVTETGKMFAGNGTTALKDLPEKGAGGLSIVDNGDGTLTSNSGVVDNGDGTLSA